MRKNFCSGLISVGLVIGFVLAGCGSSPASAQETAASAASTTPAAQSGYESSWLVGKWLSLTTGFVDELILLKDGTGTSILYKGSGHAEQTIKLTFNPDVDFFRMEAPGTGLTAPIKYSRSEDGTRFTLHIGQEVIYAREDQILKEVSEGEDPVAILRLGNYYSVAGNEKCLALFSKAADMGKSDGNVNIGNHYYKTDEAKAFEYYLKAAEQGNGQAEYNVFVFYFNSLGGVTKDTDKALKWLLKSYEHGNADAANVMKQFGLIK